MQSSLSHIIDKINTSLNKTKNRTRCANLLASNPNATWEDIHQAVVQELLDQLDFPTTPNSPLNAETLFSFLKEAATRFPDEDEEEEEDDEELEDSFVVSDEEVEYENKKRRVSRN